MNAARASVSQDRPLAALLAGFVGGGVADLRVGDVAVDSRLVRPGGLFLACRGATRHGLEFLDQAIMQGAVAVAYEPAPGLALPANTAVPLIAVPALGSRVGVVADRFFASPSQRLAVTGVTGTNGKTTVSWLLAQAYERLGRPCGVLGTLGAGRPGGLAAATLTTPDAVAVHRALAQMADAGAEAAAMEVSSHGLAQGRVAGVRFAAAVFTNLSRDHLDYHGDMEAYAQAKAKLFTECEPALAVLNTDDAWGARIAGRVDSTVPLVAVGHAPPPTEVAERARRLSIGKVAMTAQGDLAVTVDGDFGAATLTAPLVGRFNAHNAALALAVLVADGVTLADACDALAAVVAPPGRMQRIDAKGGDPLVVVDYAHTPDALAKVLQTLRESTAGRLMCVFGCGGERDAGKRGEMGRVADELADILVITDDNPRGEDPGKIVRDILGGVRHRAAHVEHDRRAAIHHAIAGAHADDVVLIAGKGHEDYQLRDGVRRHFSDAEEAAAALAARASAPGGAS